MLLNLYTIISPLHIISRQICALIFAEGCLSGSVSFFLLLPSPKDTLIVWFISIFIEKKSHFLFSLQLSISEYELAIMQSNISICPSRVFVK